MASNSTSLEISADGANIHEVLTRKLDENRGQFPERYPLPVYALPPLESRAEHAWKALLMGIRKLNAGKSIVLIPCNLGNQHWIGISIKLDAKGKAKRAELTDSVINSSSHPDELRKEFTRILQTTCKSAKTLHRDEDVAQSARLTVANLLEAAEQMQNSSRVEQKQGNNYVVHETKQRSGSNASNVSQAEDNTRESVMQEQFHDASNLSQLDGNLINNYTKWPIENITSVSELIDKLQEAKSQEANPNESTQLSGSSGTVDTRMHDSTAEKSKLRRLEEELREGLTKWNADDAAKLQSEIDDAEHQLQRYEKRSQVAKVEKKRQDLQELRRLQKLSEKINAMKKSLDAEDAAASSSIEQRLREGLKKWKLTDVAELQKEIRIVQKEIDRCMRMGEKKEADEEQEDLRELKELLALTEKIAAGGKVGDSEDTELPKHGPTLSARLHKCKTEEPSQPSAAVERAERLKSLEKTRDAEGEKVYLDESLELRATRNKSCQLRAPENNLKESREHVVADVSHQQKRLTVDDVLRRGRPATPVDRSDRRGNERNKLREATESMPVCAERTILELIENFQRKISPNRASNGEQTAEMESWQNLRDQLQREDLFFEGTRDQIKELRGNIQSNNRQFALRNLTEMLKKIRPLNVHEIRRLVEKTREAAAVIRGQEIVLLMGVTGSGKSTTIQFLAGAPMREVVVEVEPGELLEHIEADGPLDNPDLQGVTISPLSRSETRFIHSVRVDLKKAIGAHVSGEIILCDAPGFGDTAGPEVDIANSVGVIEALKECKSVKILALSSYKSVGDRGQGIQKLAHMLINMISCIQDRLGSIFYGFTKYPTKTNIHALLSEIKKTTVDQDPSLSTDKGFVTVLSDMIKKTRAGDGKIDPLHQTPEDLLEKLLNMNGIEYPGEVFRFSMSEETQACIADQVQTTKLGVRTAVKNRDMKLIEYYLDRLKFVQDLIKVGVARDAYENAVHLVNESIVDYCSDVTRQFNRALQSQDGLHDEDVSSYDAAIKHLERVQSLMTHLGTELVSPDFLLKNLESETGKRSEALIAEDLASPSIGTYLNNLHLLRRFSKHLELDYTDSCQRLAVRVEELLQATKDNIVSHDFREAAEQILTLSKCARALDVHVKKIEAKYVEAVQFLLKHLKSVAETVTPILLRHELNESDIQKIQECVEVLRSAKENAALQDRVFVYIERDQRQQRDQQRVEDISEIYDFLVQKFVRFFEETSATIKERFEKSESYALEHVKKLVNKMETVHCIPELEWKTAEFYHRTVDCIRGYTQQWKKEAEQVLFSLDRNSPTNNYMRLARSLLFIKDAEWLKRIVPEEYEFMTRHIREELVERAQNLETSLSKIDLDLKFPTNVAKATTIVEDTERLQVLERSVSELAVYRERITERFFQRVQVAFDQIQKTFVLQDNKVYQLKQELKELEAIKKEYNNLQPSRIFLKEKGYARKELLDEEIQNLEKQRCDRLKSAELKRDQLCKELKRLESIVREHMKLKTPDGRVQSLGRASDTVSSTMAPKENEAGSFLKAKGYSDITQVYKVIAEGNETMNSCEWSKKDTFTELDPTVNNLNEIRQQYEQLVKSDSTPSKQQRSLLRHREESTIELLHASIERKKKVIVESAQRKQRYDFGDRLDAAAANNALLYIDECKRVSVDRVKEMATDTRNFLQKYLNEYAHFVHAQIDSAFRQLKTLNPQGDVVQPSENFEPWVQMFFAFERFPELNAAISGQEKIEDWKKKFLDYKLLLSGKLEECKAAGKNTELRGSVDIAHRLSCLDRFCGDVFGEAGFGALYRQYHLEMTRERKQAYRTVLDYICKEDYANAAIALSEIDDHPLHPKDQAQIELDLSRTLNKLMRDTESMVHWLSGKIERDAQCRGEIQLIRGNIDKTRIAASKKSIVDLLDKETKGKLKRFDDHIGEILSGMILRGLKSVDSFMGVDGFAESEQGLENIGLVIRELSGYCTSEEIATRDAELRKKLEEVVQEITERNKFDDIKTYPANPPKDLLAKLQVVASRGDVKYRRAYQSVLGQVTQSFHKAIDEARKASLAERATRIDELKYILCFLPEELQNKMRSQIEEVHRLSVTEEQKCRSQLEEITNLVEDDDREIRKVGRVAEEYLANKQTDFFEALREKVLKKLRSHRNNAEIRLKQHEMPLALDAAKKIFKYHVALGSSTILQVGAIYNHVFALTIDALNSYCDTLISMSSIEHTPVVETALTNILAALTFSHTFDNHIQQIVTDELVTKVTLALHEVRKYLTECSQKFPEALLTMNIAGLCEMMKAAKQWDGLLKIIREGRVQHSLMKNCFPDMSVILSYGDMVSSVEKEIVRLQARLDAELINDRTVKFEDARDKLFSEIMDAISILREISSEMKGVLPSPVDVERSVEQLRIKMRALGTHLLSIAQKDQLNESHCDDFRKTYDHLLSIEKHLRIDEANVRRYLTESEGHIFSKLDQLRRKLERSELAIEQVAEILQDAKLLAENLSMFDTRINAQIDEMLKKYKSKVSRSAIDELTTILGKTDVGSRVISEHSALSGEDWRKRREKMQDQDNLEYVLDNLTGDDIDKEALRRRFVTFKTTYDRLVSANLPKQEQATRAEPNLDSLTSALKFLVEKAAPPSTTVEWTQPLKDKLPEILAHIFAVWTLKNTQHYNASRGIEEGQAYLLMPHVGQVIAIFRMLGMGYKECTTVLGRRVPWIGKISDDLVNNLVEVGTGEGKSVVLAITACVFALIGVDVCCSCYSEMLSNRDKEDFASVFRTLGIEEHIAYGTFKKLCEDLLNEQCKIRKAVREMILSNATTVKKTETKVKSRPKVLLIDEVDVFLSEKYYGGMYTPALNLKDAYIRALLDALWVDQTIGSLRQVKTLPEYEQCASRFSHWILLFDEAIKDMLAARKSFESSTYVVQNDRITYIVGESAVGNVVRGYGTVWTYYKEHANNNISLASLEQNVGMIINCGEFSYAEMPLEYAYIAGVTGTLETLAAPEKAILKNVYMVDRSTYIPSVFGKSNRNYNPMNDVHVVSESEYYTRIRGEIDMMCRAKRAILVFFESEEKLLAFYDSEKMESIRESVQIVTERIAAKERELAIKRAATEGKVTLSTRTFGRGIDFICRSQNVLANGGVHVLQTFFSQELSEEYQIMGRTARQGEQGSYRMILLHSDLEWVIGPTWMEEIPRITGSTLYKKLNQARNALYESRCGAKELGITQCKKDHEASRDFLRALAAGQMSKVKAFLLEQNRGANLSSGSTRTVLLMDATGSMSSLLSATKDTVCTMFERAAEVLEQKGLPGDAFQMQFVVYRDYDCGPDGLLQSSSWETKPTNLRSFMTTVKAKGGGDYEEAIEIGLWHAFQESEKSEGISQVILIGDAPTKGVEAIKRDRKTAGGKAFWNDTKFNFRTHYLTELEKLKEKDIPIHAFYLADGAKSNFEEIARETGGRCEFLQIHSPQGAELLTNFVTEEVLRRAAGDQGDAAVELYRKKYVRTAYTS